jgi:cation diffusion facilitator CzcD-associated flavoprotein CzcO
MAGSPTRVRHLIVGAGFAGLGMAIKLDEAGQRDYVVIEKGPGVGGTWRENTYPGAACDVPSQLYCFSFAPNPDWKGSFAAQPEIEAYLRRLARQSGVLDRFVFETRFESAEYDEASQVWRVCTRGAGDAACTRYVADNLITASGGLSEPRLPRITGLGSFSGEVFHSARWNHDLDLTGKRVAVIGTGASAIQIVPELQRAAGRLDVYQRTAPWVLPRHDRTYSRLERLALKHLPGLGKLYRSSIYWTRECYLPGFVWRPGLTAPVAAIARRNIRKAIADPGLAAALTPSYQIGCKRILLSDTYYPALRAPGVELITDPITEVAGQQIRTRDGTSRETDVIVAATGFRPTDQPIARQITGRGGRRLAEVWAAGGAAAYKGTTVRGFPNLFQLTGPGTGLGHSSMIIMIEAQIAYITDAIGHQQRCGYGAAEPLPSAQRAWNDDLQRRMRRTVWQTGGCDSWYLDRHGRNTTLWPRTTYAFRKLLARFDPVAYELTPPSPPPSRVAGDPVRIAITKWGGRPHWEFSGVFLGSDRHGDWVGVRAGTPMSRPGAFYAPPVDQVCLVPATGPDLDRGFLAAFHAPGGKIRLYTDITTPPAWDGDTLRAVDLDLG